LGHSGIARYFEITGAGLEIPRNSGILGKGHPVIELVTGVVFMSCEFAIMDCQRLIAGNGMAIPK
jgi:hypothetical protein